MKQIKNENKFMLAIIGLVIATEALLFSTSSTKTSNASNKAILFEEDKILVLDVDNYSLADNNQIQSLTLSDGTYIDTQNQSVYLLDDDMSVQQWLNEYISSDIQVEYLPEKNYKLVK